MRCLDAESASLCLTPLLLLFDVCWAVSLFFQLAGVPFDSKKHVVPSAHGRVTDNEVRQPRSAHSPFVLRRMWRAPGRWDSEGPPAHRLTPFSHMF